MFERNSLAPPGVAARDVQTRGKTSTKPSTLSRRDFLNGSALSLLAGTTLAPAEILGLETRAPYPPALTGMRGSHEGSFETAHALA